MRGPARPPCCGCEESAWRAPGAKPPQVPAALPGEALRGGSRAPEEPLHPGLGAVGCRCAWLGAPAMAAGAVAGGVAMRARGSRLVFPEAVLRGSAANGAPHGRAGKERNDEMMQH